jgi:salicylate hydroxylase
MTGVQIGVCGGGPGGLAAAIALRKVGHEVTVFERAAAFGRIGADVNLTPNAVHALDGLGVGEYLRNVSARPTFRISRTWDTGEETSRLPMGDTAEKKYGAPQLTIHRADLLSALAEQLPADVIQFGRQATGVDATGDRPVIEFADGSRMEMDVVIAADGIHSGVRESQFGVDVPEYTGLVSYRSVIETSTVDVPNLDAFTKWWGPTGDQQIVVFPLTHGREMFIFATARDDDWSNESWTTPGDIDELRAAHAGWHPDVTALLDACDSTMKSALHIREPMPQWSKGAVTLLGDAAHPMVPFMAQGCCMAVEDAVVLSRALDGVESAAQVSEALSFYEAIRKDRTARIQRESSNNEWMKGQANADWLYAYDAWTTPIGS